MNTKEKMEIMQAWLDGKTIQYCSDHMGEWKTLTREPAWDFISNEYRIKPKQKVKKTIEYHCFESVSGHLVFVKDGCKYNIFVNVNEYTRVPEFDKTREIEVEE